MTVCSSTPAGLTEAGLEDEGFILWRAGRSLTFGFDGRVDPGGVFGRVKVSHRHHSGEYGFWFLQGTEEHALPHGTYGGP